MLLKNIDNYVLLSFLIGLLPAFFIIHVAPVDFSGFYFQAISFLKYRSYSYQFIQNYCNNPLNTGLNARAPVVPFFMALSIGIFGQNLLGVYVPFLLVRVLLTPLMYIISSFYLPKNLAFLAAITTIFIPKLHTYSLGSLEADVFIAFFYLLAIFFYQKSQYLTKHIPSVLTGISLGMGSLTKSIGLGIACGFLFSLFFSNIIHFFSKKNIRRNFIVLLLYFIILIGPYLLWTIIVHHQLYITTQHDKSIWYILNNLPSLLFTIPLYLGLNFSIGIKALLVSYFFLTLLLIGVISTLHKRHFELIFPIVITLVLVATLESCVIGGAIPFSYEFATILGFMMFPVTTVFFVGINTVLTYVLKFIKHNKISKVVVLIFLGLIMYKIINNYFTARYALNFVPQEYYVSLPTVLKNKTRLPDIEYVEENGLLMYKGPVVHRIMREQFTNFRFDPFSAFYLKLLFSVSVICVLYCFWKIWSIKEKNELE